MMINKIIIIMINRKEVDGNEADKQNNRFTTISGSPGIGKSTFLCHFPESKEYREYCKNKEVMIFIIDMNTRFNI